MGLGVGKKGEGLTFFLGGGSLTDFEDRIKSNFRVAYMHDREDKYLLLLYFLCSEFEVLTACWRDQGKGTSEK